MARVRSGVDEGRPQREIDGVELELASLDLREVEQAVQHAQQVFGGGLHGLQESPRFFSQRCVEGQFGHAEDGVHGRAELVADVGEELVLGTIAGLRRLFGLSQLAFQPLAVRNVLNDLDAIGGLSRRVELERDGQVSPDRSYRPCG